MLLVAVSYSVVVVAAEDEEEDEEEGQKLLSYLFAHQPDWIGRRRLLSQQQQQQLIPFDIWICSCKQLDISSVVVWVQTWIHSQTGLVSVYSVVAAVVYSCSRRSSSNNSSIYLSSFFLQLCDILQCQFTKKYFFLVSTILLLLRSLIFLHDNHLRDFSKSHVKIKQWDTRGQEGYSGETLFLDCNTLKTGKRQTVFFSILRSVAHVRVLAFKLGTVV